MLLVGYEEDPEEYEDDETEDGRGGWSRGGGALSSADSNYRLLLVDDIVFHLREQSLSYPHPPLTSLLGLGLPSSPQTSISLSTRGRGERLARYFRITITLLPPLRNLVYIPPPVDHRDDIPESEQPPRKSSVDAERVGDSGIRDVGYGIRGTWVIRKAVPEIASYDVDREDAQDSRSLYSQRVDMDSRRSILLMGDRMTLQETVWMVEEEAYASDTDTGYSCRCTLILTQYQANEVSLSDAASMSLSCASEEEDIMLASGPVEQQRRARQPGPDARIPDHQDALGCP
ncbi:hypothetical protein Tco_1393637 [Tanacetum coccineum]